MENKTCTKCGVEKAPIKFDPRNLVCKRCKKKGYNAKLKVVKPEVYLYQRIKKRARDIGREFNLEPSDIIIPEFCPYLGTRLEIQVGSPNSNSLSIDRIDSSKGYVKGNVEVISQRANRAKSDLTATELVAFAKAVLEKLQAQ